MANAHPYISSPGALIKTIKHLRNTFPSKIDAGTLQKLGLAPNNESYLINILKFLSVIDDDHKTSTSVGKIFSNHDDATFENEFAGIVKSAYSDLFETHGDDAWKLSSDQLITFFRAADQSSAIVGKRQSKTFGALSGISGHAELPKVKSASSSPSKSTSTKVKAKAPGKGKETGSATTQPNDNIAPTGTPSTDVALTVRVEINLSMQILLSQAAE